MKKFVMLLALLSFACAGPQRFNIYKDKPDPFNAGVEHYSSSPIKLKKTSLSSHSFSFMKLHYTRDNGKNLYYISVYYSGPDWLFIDKLITLTDGKKSVFQNQAKNTGNVDTFFSTVNVSEEGIFFVGKEWFANAEKAKSILVRVRGKNGKIDKKLTPFEVSNIGFFFNHVSRELAAQ